MTSITFLGFLNCFIHPIILSFTILETTLLMNHLILLAVTAGMQTSFSAQSDQKTFRVDIHIRGKAGIIIACPGQPNTTDTPVFLLQTPFLRHSARNSIPVGSLLFVLLDPQKLMTQFLITALPFGTATATVSKATSRIV